MRDIKNIINEDIKGIKELVKDGIYKTLEEATSEYVYNVIYSWSILSDEFLEAAGVDMLEEEHKVKQLYIYTRLVEEIEKVEL